MTIRTIRIEQKASHVPAAAAQLRNALLKARLSDLTPADAAAASGLPLGLCEAALFHLATRYPARIRVGEAATLRFTFATLDRARRPDARARLEALWKAHADAIKVSLLLVAVPPFLLTVAGHAAALAAAFSHPESLASIVPPLWALPVKLVAWLISVVAAVAGLGTLLYCQLLPLQGLLGVTWLLGDAIPTLLREPGHELWGLWPLWSAALLVACFATASLAGSWLLYRHWVFGDRNLMARRFWRHTAGMLLGPSPTRDDALSDERRLAALIVRHQGVLTLADLVALFGWTLEEAESQLARILLDYGGDVLVTDEGALLFRFDPMLVTAGVASLEADTRPCYEREGAYPSFWDAPPRFIQVLGFLTALGLLGLFLHPHLTPFPPMHPWGEGGLVARLTGPSSGLVQGLGVYPYMLVLAPILIRIPLWLVGRKRHQARAPFLRAVRLATEHPEGHYVRHVPQEALVQLGGDIDVERTRPNGKVWVHFPAFAAATREAARLRQAEAGPRAEEAVAFDTEGDRP